MSNLKIGFKRLTGSVDDLKQRFRKRDRDETPPVPERSFELLAPRSPVDELCNPTPRPPRNRTVMVECTSSEDGTVEISESNSSVSLTSKDAALLDRFSIVHEPSILFKRESMQCPRPIVPDLNRPLPPSPVESKQPEPVEPVEPVEPTQPAEPLGFEAHTRESIEQYTQLITQPVRVSAMEPIVPVRNALRESFEPVENPEPEESVPPPALTVKLQHPALLGEFRFMQHMRKLESELVDASTALDTETDSLVKDMRDLSALTGVKGLEHAPTPLLHKNSTRSTLFKRVQCAEHDAYQLRIENEIMSKKVANGDRLQNEMKDLNARNYKLFEELSAIEKSVQQMSTSSELSTFVQTDESEDALATAPIPKTASIATELACQVATELLAEAHLQWQQERKTLKAEIKLLSDNGAELERELKTSTQQCEQLREQAQQAESSYSALYDSFKNVQARYKASLQQLDTHLREIYPTQNLGELMDAQLQLMQGQRQLLRLQEYYSQALQAAHPDKEKVYQVFSILEPLL